MTLANILADGSAASEKVLIYTLIGGHVVTLVTLAIKALIDQSNRVQDRLDAESKARIIMAAGKEREERINLKIEENTKVSKDAFEAANGIKAENAAHLKAVAEVAKVIVEKTPKQ